MKTEKLVCKYCSDNYLEGCPNCVKGFIPQHTKGKWWLQPLTPGATHLGIYCKNKMICTVIRIKDSIIQMNANARLIEQSPPMYELLRDLLDANDYDSIENCKLMAKKIINKVNTK